MPITDPTRVATRDARDAWFFDRPFSPDELDLLAEEAASWLCSDHLRWLVEHVPARREPNGPLERLEWPEELDGGVPAGGGRVGLARTVAALQEICDWSQPGTAWDQRVNGERPLDAPGAPVGGTPAAAVAEQAAALGLCSHGRMRTSPRAIVVLGGRRLAPLNRARTAAAAIESGGEAPVRVILLAAHRPLDRRERESSEVRDYAPHARTEAELMSAAAERAFGTDARAGRGGVHIEDVRLIEVPPSAGARRASTYETLRFASGELAAIPGPIGLVTSPTCRPFQHLDAARALGLSLGLSFELIAHPRAWAAAGSPHAAPHVYLQEIRSAVQAAGRLADALVAADEALALPA